MNKRQLLTFKDAVAVTVVNRLNDLFKKDGTMNRAFLHTVTQVEISVPAGSEVDIVDSILDDYDGVYGDEWFQKPESTQ